MTAPLTPLNGGRTHPLKPASIAVLRELVRGPIPRYAINPGVIDRLGREYLIEIVTLKAGHAAVVRITDAGRSRIAELEGKR